MESEGRTKQGSPDSSPRPQPQNMQKKTSFRSLFSFFKGSASKRARAQADHDAQVSPGQSALIGSSFSTTSSPSPARRPSTVETCASEPLPEREPTGLDLDSSQIRPPFTHRPTSSSSSSSSYENGSETSTINTTLTNSSASSLRSGRDPEASRSNLSLKKSKRVSECYRTSPSPLSTVTDARNYPYILPHSLSHQSYTPPTERTNNEKPNRRHSISRLMSMRTRSTPDLTADVPPVPPLPRMASGKNRRKSFAPSPATAQDILDHRAILGADPAAAGSGFYRYPTIGKEPAPARRGTGSGPRRPPAGGDQWKRNSWGGHYDGDVAMDLRNMGGNSRGSPRRDTRGRGGQTFRRNVASQVILEESQDAAEAAAPNRRRHSEIAPPDSWGGDVLQMEPVPPIPASYLQSSSSSSEEPSTEASTASTSASSVSTISEDGKQPQQSLYNNWDHVSAQLEKHSNQIPAITDDGTKLANCSIQAATEMPTLQHTIPLSHRQ